MDGSADVTPPDGTTRRFFLGTAAGLTGAALAAAATPARASDLHTTAAVDSRAFTGGTVNLVIDRQPAGGLHFVTGGEITGEVVLEKLGSDGVIRKHLAGVGYGDFSFTLDFPISKPLAAEIDSMFQMTFDRFDGSIQSADMNKKIFSERAFTNALVTEVGFPACDAGSKDPATLTVKISPEQISRVPKPDGKVPAPGKTQRATVSNFKLQIDGLDCKKVTKVDGFTIKVAVQQVSSDQPQLSSELPLFLEIPDLKVTLLESSAQTWFDWFDSFVVQGNSGQEQERNGTLTLYTADLKTPLATVSFSHLGIFELEPTDDGTMSSTSRKLTAQLYCEQMKIKLATA
jgi:hypothetical protein